jgi:hypothetical protein
MVIGWRAWAIDEQWVDVPSGHPHAHLTGYRLVSVGNDSEFSMWRPDEKRPAECLAVHSGRELKRMLPRLKAAAAAITPTTQSRPASSLTTYDTRLQM